VSNAESRREFLRRAAALGAAGVAGGLASSCRARGFDAATGKAPVLAGAAGGDAPPAASPPAPSPAPAAPVTPSAASVMPTAFVGHGSPGTLFDPQRGALWAKWAGAMPRPKAILAVSAHYEAMPFTIGATERHELFYDYYGFPDEYYAVKYDAPGAPALAARVEALMGGPSRIDRDPDRGHDHGMFVPLRWMYPQADVPVLSVSMPTQDAKTLWEIGRALAPLRREGVLILGSGNVTHNLRRTGRDGNQTPSWAADFDAWCAEALSKGDVDAMLDYRRKAPAPDMSHPTKDHWDPMLVVLGAAEGSKASFPITGWEGASISRRCAQFG
jgi:4,5-DOPA dioxygenase extradiol